MHKGSSAAATHPADPFPHRGKLNALHKAGNNAALLKEIEKTRYSGGKPPQPAKQNGPEKGILKFSLFVILCSKSFPIQVSSNVHREMKVTFQE